MRGGAVLKIDRGRIWLHDESRATELSLDEVLNVFRTQSDEILGWRLLGLANPVVRLDASAAGNPDISVWAQADHEEISLGHEAPLNLDYIANGRTVMPLREPVFRAVFEKLGLNSWGGAQSALVGAAAYLIKASATSGFELQISQRCREVLAQTPQNVPSVSTAKPLWNYQSIGLAWMHRLWTLGFGGILGDEMGVGKTLQLLTLACSVADEDKTRPCLVIVPGNLLLKWCKDIVDFTPDYLDLVHVHNGSNRPRDPKFLDRQRIVLTTYSMLVQDSQIFELLNFSSVICDEAHELREPETLRHEAVRGLRSKAKFLATGTPIQNRLLDYWALIDIVDPGILGSREEFLALVDDSPDDARYLAELTAHRVLRRTQEQVDIEIPAGTVVRVPLALTASQRAFYRDLSSSSSASTVSASSLARLSSLRLFAAHPGASMGSGNAENNAKTDYLLSALDVIFQREEKAVIFVSDFNEPRDLYLEAIRSRFPYVWSETLDGRTQIEVRQPLLDQFSKTNFPAVILVNPSVGGQGLDMVAANHVFHMNPAWNPARTDQATFRVTRPGQTRETHSYHLYFDGTIEDNIEQLVQDKRDISNAALSRLEDEALKHNKTIEKIMRMGGEA